MRGGLLCLALTLPGAARALTAAQLDTNARVLALDAVSATRQRFTDAQIYQYLNEAQRTVIDYSRCLRNSTNFTLVPGTTYYSMPANFLFVERVTVGAKWLQERSPASLDGITRSWETATGYPVAYFVNFSSRAQVGFYPFPQAAADTDTVKVEYDVQATDLVLTTDVPFNGQTDLFSYHYILAYYAAAMMAQVEGQPQMSAQYLGVFKAGEDAMQTHCAMRPNYLPSAAGSP